MTWRVEVRPLPGGRAHVVLMSEGDVPLACGACSRDLLNVSDGTLWSRIPLTAAEVCTHGRAPDMWTCEWCGARYPEEHRVVPHDGTPPWWSLAAGAAEEVEGG